MTGSPELSVIILSWNTRDLLQACLRTVLGRDHGLRLEVIVVDNGSEDGSADLVAAEFPDAVLLRNDTNRGYAAGNNQGLAQATAPLLLLLNSDTEVRGDGFSRLVGFLNQHPEYGAVAPRLVFPDGRVQTSCMRFPDLTVGFQHDSLWERRFGRSESMQRYFMDEFDHLQSRDVDQPPGACFLMRREVMEQVGVFDESLFLFFNDVDFCRRIVDGGWRIHYLAEAEVVHHEGASTSRYRQFVQEWNVNRVRYYRKHHGVTGSLVIKTAVLMRGLEEGAKTLWKAPAGEKRAGLGEICRVLGAALKA